MARRSPSLRHAITDRDRLDWLEVMANRQGGLLLHDGTEKGRTGLGLNLGFGIKRTLRQAIDQAYIPEDIPEDIPKKTPKKKKTTPPKP